MKAPRTKAYLKGTLTLHGVSKDVAFDLVHIGEGKDPRAATAAASTPPPPSSAASSANYMVPNIPDEMTINLFVEGVRNGRSTPASNPGGSFRGRFAVVALFGSQECT